MTDAVIKVTDVSKAYRIWHSPAARLKSIGLHALKSAVPALWDRCTAMQVGCYHDFYALRCVSLEIRRGESAAIVGRNGSGKSTLLQIIAGTLAPTHGQVEVNGRVAALLELGSGFNPEFTGRENVMLNASILGLSEREIHERFDAIAAFADIGDFIDQPTKTYSSGMTMRLAFAVIAHVDADILIVDEAMAVGDVFFVQKCMRFIRDFQERGTLLLVTHDTSAVTSLCHRAIWLHGGHCLDQGTSKEITEKYLAATYANKVETPPIKPKSLDRSPGRTITRPKKDQRQEFLNHSNLRTDLQVLDFNPQSGGFGAGGANICNVELFEQSSFVPLAYIVGGEDVVLKVEAQVHQTIAQPIMGFHLKNSLGQYLFGDNTFLTYLDSPILAEAGRSLVAEFHFQMPYLPVGEYVFAAAIAEGTQENHVQHHWMHDALVLRSQSSHVAGGLIGIPMTEVVLNLKGVVSSMDVVHP